MTASELIAIFQLVDECVTRCTRDLQAIKSPRTEYIEQVDQVNSRLAAAWTRLFASEAIADRSAIQSEIITYGGDLHRLEANYTAGLNEAELSHERQIGAELQGLCDGLVAALGRDLVNKSLERLPGVDGVPEDEQMVDFQPETQLQPEPQPEPATVVISEVEEAAEDDDEKQDEKENDEKKAIRGKYNRVSGCAILSTCKKTDNGSESESARGRMI